MIFSSMTMKNNLWKQAASCFIAIAALILGCSGSCRPLQNAATDKTPSGAEPAAQTAPINPVEDTPKMQTEAASSDAIKGDVVTPTLVSLTFDNDEVGNVPAAIELKETFGRGTPAIWKVVADQSSPNSPRAFGAVETKNTGRTYNVALVSESSFKNVVISMQVKAVSGKEDQGGGPVWRAIDADNYYIARWNPLEDNFRIYYVKDGERAQIASMKIKLDPTKWHSIKIIMKGHHIEGWLNSEKRLEVNDDTFKEAGMVGLWTKADASTLFDDFIARPAAGE